MQLPSLVEQRARSLGATGDAWLAALPRAIDRLSSEWHLETGETFDDGTSALVYAATRGPDAVVVKIPIPTEDDIASFEHAVTVHDLCEGQGCARLLDVTDDPPAMLIERLGPNLHELGYDTESVLDAIADTLLEFWRPAPSSTRLPTGPEKADWLSGYITEAWDRLGRPCDRAVVDRALSYCDRRATSFDRATAVIVHGDAHGWNTLRSTDGFKFVDPEGIVSERAHDLAVPMREYNDPLLDGDTTALTRQRAERLGRRCDVDTDAIWEWGFVERVSTGLANLDHFDDGRGATFLTVAERCL